MAHAVRGGGTPENAGPRREADFLIARNKKPYLLLEAKQSAQDPAPALAYFHKRLKPPHTFQVVRDAPPAFLTRRSGGLVVVSAARFLACLP